MSKGRYIAKETLSDVRGMTSKVTVLGEPTGLTKDMKLEGENMVSTTALFDSGSDMGCHTVQLAQSIQMKDLPSEYTAVTTANGTDKRYYNKKAIKIKGQIAADNKEKIHTFESIEVGERIGNEKKHMKPYVNIIAELTGMPENLRQHFNSQCEDNEDAIHIIIGQCDVGMLMNEIHPEQIGLKQHHLLPNVVIYQNTFTGNLILAGDMGINQQLIDKDYPIFYIHKTNWAAILEAKRNGDEKRLGDLIGENFDVKKP